MKRRYCRGK